VPLVAATALAIATLGIADSDSATFTDPAWAGLNVRYARAVVPWDVALTDPNAPTAAGARRADFDRWVAAAAAAGVRPLVTFERSLDPSRAGKPTLAVYTQAMQAFVAGYTSVRDLAPWNEPNFRDASFNPYAGDPAGAAALWPALQSACPGCIVAAGEFAGIPGDPYVAQYREALGTQQPAVWSYHAHLDAESATAPVTRFFATALPATARLWIDEAGAYFRDASGRIDGDGAQRTGAQRLLGVRTVAPRVDRLYYYNLDNQCSTASRCAVQDRGLVAPTPFDQTPLGYDTNGRERPAYAVLRDHGPALAPAAPKGFTFSVRRRSARRFTLRVTPPGAVTLRARGARLTVRGTRLTLKARARGRHRVTLTATSAGTTRTAHVTLRVR